MFKTLGKLTLVTNLWSLTGFTLRKQHFTENEPSTVVQWYILVGDGEISSGRYHTHMLHLDAYLETEANVLVRPV